MAKSNRDRVSEVMDALKEGLGPFVLREFKATYKANLTSEIGIALSSDRFELPGAATKDDAALLREIDTQGWLKLFFGKYNDVFRDKLGHPPRSYASELITARNDWAHQKAFTSASAQRVADTAALLLDAIGANEAAQTSKDVARELMRLRYEEEAKQSAKKATIEDTAPTPMLIQTGLKPWRQVVRPHNDVATGRYVQAEFAADLAQVVSGKAEPEYGDAAEFFRRTFLTEGLVTLLVNGLRRLNGQGGDPVVQLQTSFGGGKTHSLLAMYHLCQGKISLAQIPGGEKIAAQLGNVDDKLEAQCAVIVGTAFSATEPRRHKDATTHTLWGEIAYQLGGAKAYKLVEQADLSGISPGSDTLVEILEQNGPALIIIDELVAFARNIYNARERTSAGTFDSVVTFMQSLTEAVKRASDSVLLVSVPESNMEIGGEGGKIALEMLSKVIGRVESLWKPVSASESFEIVRRRLFSGEIDFAARDAVINAFRKLYRDQASDFPNGVAEADYAERMRAAYPIHPELFDRLYEDWSTLERFQRTRGVLRLMAAVIHQLWIGNDASLLIMPGSMPMATAAVRNEVTRYLPENWSAVLDTDIDGEGSRPLALDKQVSTLGQYAACRRVARAIFIGSAPSSAAQRARGIEEVRVRLGVVQPGEQVAIFNDALRRMAQSFTYLYGDNGRYWYDTRPTVNRLAQDRAANTPLDKVQMEIVERLRKLKPDREKFSAVHTAPQSSADVADDARARLVILDPQYSHKRNGESSALAVAKEMLLNRGTTPRLYRNMLIFAAMDANDGAALENIVRDYLAWDSIQDEAEQLNLDAQQRKQVANNLKQTETTVNTRLQEAYSWLLVPTQETPTSPIEIQTAKISGADGLFERAARKLKQSEWLIPKWSPDLLRQELDRYLWRDQPHLGVNQLWDYLAQYCYLPRLLNQDVLIATIRDGVARLDQPFSYATQVGADGQYMGLALHEGNVTIYANKDDVIVKADVALSQHKAAETASSLDAKVTGEGYEVTIHSSDEARPTETAATLQQTIALKTRYYASIKIDPRRAGRQLQDIVNEVIQHLSSQIGVEVEIILEIMASRPQGFEENTIRIVSENSRTLKFLNSEFGTK